MKVKLSILIYYIFQMTEIGHRLYLQFVILLFLTEMDEIFSTSEAVLVQRSVIELIEFVPINFILANSVIIYVFCWYPWYNLPNSTELRTDVMYKFKIKQHRSQEQDLGRLVFWVSTCYSCSSSVRC